MWHEARKQEKKIRCIMIDHKRRAERRKVFYEKIVIIFSFFFDIFFISKKLTTKVCVRIEKGSG
jgi:hypothetical protein